MTKDELNKFEGEARSFIARKLTEAHQNLAKPDYTLDHYLTVLKSIEAVTGALQRALALCQEDK